MKIEYYAETDSLSIVFTRAPGASVGEDSSDDDVTIFYGEDRGSASRAPIVEILIEHASERVDLSEMRRHFSFEEISSRPAEEEAA
jgi:uncharacterized protein YuzE